MSGLMFPKPTPRKPRQRKPIRRRAIKGYAKASGNTADHFPARKPIARRKPLRYRKRQATNEEKNYLGKIADLGCIICGSPACVHHIRTGKGLAQRASHYETIPLCHFHHQGKEGIHTLGTRQWQAKYGSEIELLGKVRKILGETEAVKHQVMELLK